jgi:hypothetical protein
LGDDDIKADRRILQHPHLLTKRGRLRAELRSRRDGLAGQAALAMLVPHVGDRVGADQPHHEQTEKTSQSHRRAASNSMSHLGLTKPRPANRSWLFPSGFGSDAIVGLGQNGHVAFALMIRRARRRVPM